MTQETLKVLLHEDGGRAAAAVPSSAKPGGGADAQPMFNTHTLSKGNFEFQKRVINKRNRTLFSRMNLGLMLAGKYYFLTLTSSPKSPALNKSWYKFRRWLKRIRPLTSWCVCFTSEGHGVIHLVLRIHQSEKRLDVKEVRKFWERVHKASQIKLLWVSDKDKENLANYISDQRKKKNIGTEFLWQDQMISWKWSKGWLPLGFAKAFGRFWWHYRDCTPILRTQLLKEWLIECHFNPSNITKAPHIRSDGSVKFYV